MHVVNVVYRPMLAYDAPLPPRVGDGFDFEIKFDGFRCGLVIEAGVTKLISRQGTSITGWFPELTGVLNQVSAKNVLINGEVISGDGSIETFNHLLRRARMRGRTPKERLSITFVAFDVLSHDDCDWTSRAIEDRRSLLRSVVTENQQIAISRVFDDGRALLTAAESRGLEGIVAKRKGSVYEVGLRSRSWLKTKVPGAHLVHDWNGNA